MFVSFTLALTRQILSAPLFFRPYVLIRIEHGWLGPIQSHPHQHPSDEQLSTRECRCVHGVRSNVDGLGSQLTGSGPIALHHDSLYILHHLMIRSMMAVGLSVHQSVNRSVCQSVSLSVCQSVRLPICQSVSRSVCPSLTLSVVQSGSRSVPGVFASTYSRCSFISLQSLQSVQSLQSLQSRQSLQSPLSVIQVAFGTVVVLVVVKHISQVVSNNKKETSVWPIWTFTLPRPLLEGRHVCFACPPDAQLFSRAPFGV